MGNDKEEKNVQEEVIPYKEHDAQSGWTISKCNFCHSYISPIAEICPGCKRKIRWKN